MRFADTSRSHEDETANRPLAASHTAAAAANCPRHFTDSLALTNDVLTEMLFELAQQLRFASLDFFDWNIGHHSDSMRHIVIGQLDSAAAFLGSNFCLELFTNLANALFVHSSSLVIFVQNSILHALIEMLELFEIFTLAARAVAPLDANSGSCLVEHVNRFIGHETVADVAVAHIHCRLDHFVGNFDAMMLFIIIFKTFQNSDCLRHSWLFDDDCLETPF